MHGQKRQASGKMAIRYASRRSVCRVCPLRGRCLAGKGARREIERWTDEDVMDITEVTALSIRGAHEFFAGVTGRANHRDLGQRFLHNAQCVFRLTRIATKSCEFGA